MTNAHVVAGEYDTTVQVGGRGEQVEAEPVAFDPTDDIAVLRVRGLGVPPLPLAASTESGTSGAILGYPENGPFDVQPGRIGRTQTVLTQDAYGQGPVQRLLTPLRGLVRPGNSGGPLVDDAGRVLTTVFAVDRRRRAPRGLRGRRSDRRERAAPRRRRARRACLDGALHRRLSCVPPGARYADRHVQDPPGRREAVRRTGPGARPAGAVQEERGLSRGARARDHLGRRAPRSARGARSLRPEVQELADGRPADRARPLQAGGARRALAQADDGGHQTARARGRGRGGQRLRRRP